MLGVFLTVIHVIVSLGLILVVLLQSGKGGGLAGSIGGSALGGAQAAFGGRGTADLLTKLTTTFAVLFMILSMILTVYTMNATGIKGESKLRQMMNEEQRAVKPFTPEQPEAEKIESPATQNPATLNPTPAKGDSN